MNLQENFASPGLWRLPVLVTAPSAASQLTWVTCMTTKVEIIQDFVGTANVALLDQMRYLAEYLLASQAEVLKDLAYSETHMALIEALKALRVTAGALSLEMALEDDRTRHFQLPVARPAGYGSAGYGPSKIEIGGEDFRPLRSPASSTFICPAIPSSNCPGV
jgi:hypothetical protein